MGLSLNFYCLFVVERNDLTGDFASQVSCVSAVSSLWRRETNRDVQRQYVILVAAVEAVEAVNLKSP